MSQITKLVSSSGPGSGTVQSVSGGNNITITGTPTVNPIVNVSGTTNHAVQVGNALGALTSIPVGLTGQVLTGVTGADPVFAAAPASGISTLTGNTGGPVSPTLGNVDILTANSTLEFAGTASTLTLDFGLRNLFLGVVPPITSGDSNVSLGFNCGTSVSSGGDNVFIGFDAANGLTDGFDNVCIGFNAMGVASTSTSNNVSIGSGSLQNFSGSSENVAIGFECLNQLANGGGNVALGANSGSNYNSSESANILILNTGQNGENGVTRIGSNGNQTSCFISGIDSVNVGSVATVVTEAGDQLGTAVLTAGTNITITPGANTITIDAAGGGGGGPAFLASIAATSAGVTGDGTVYTIAYDTVVFDIGGNFSGGTTFTAPNTGRYSLSVQQHLVGILGTNLFEYMLIQTTAASYEVQLDSPFAASSGGELVSSGTVFADMTAGDTAITIIDINGSGVPNISLYGSTATGTRTTMFAGFQVL